MKPEESLCTSCARIRSLLRVSACFAVALLAFSYGTFSTLMAQRIFGPPVACGVYDSMNQIPLNGPPAPQLVRPTQPAQIYNRDSGQWEVDKSGDLQPPVGPTPPAPPVSPIPVR
jgi:hypothetical protein